MSVDAYDIALKLLNAFQELGIRLIFNPASDDYMIHTKDHNNRTPALTFRTYQILPHTNSYFHCLYSYLDLLQ